jgi:hypothetical protein
MVLANFPGGAGQIFQFSRGRVGADFLVWMGLFYFCQGIRN